MEWQSIGVLRWWSGSRFRRRLTELTPSTQSTPSTRSTAVIRPLLLSHQNRIDRGKLWFCIGPDLLTAFYGLDQKIKSGGSYFGGILRHGRGQTTCIDHLESLRGSIGAHHQNFSGFTHVLDRLHHSKRHGVVAAIESFQIGVGLHDVGGDIQGSQPVPVRRLARHQLNILSDLKSFRCPFLPSFVRCRPGLTFNNRDFASTSAELLDNKVRPFLAYRDVIRRDKRLHVTASLFQAAHIYFFVELDEKNSLFISLGGRLHQVHR